MKFRILAVALFLTSILATGQTKVGSVNSELIVGIMPEMKTVVANLGEYAKKLDSSYQVKVKEYEEKVAAFQKLGDVSDNFKKIKLDEISSLEQGLQQSQQNGNQLIQLKRNELLQPLYKKISDEINKIAKAEGFTQILTTSGNEFAYVDERFDITKKVMDNLGLKLPEKKPAKK
jgi:outer membrane protein